MEEPSQELMFKLSMFEQQIRQLQQQLEAIEQGIVEMNNLDKGLDGLVGKKGKEIFAPIGRGIFARAKLESEDLNVDVGGGNFVKKSIPETKKIIEEQIKKLENVKKELEEALEKLGKELQKLMEEGRKEEEKKGKEEEKKGKKIDELV
jgi:prefoldin alpha subunit